MQVVGPGGASDEFAAIKAAYAANQQVGDLVATAVSLASVQRCVENCSGDSSAYNKPTVIAVFPNVQALGRVFVKLAAWAIGPPLNDQSLKTLKQLLDLALTLDVVNK